MAKVTVSVIKADVGGYVGHSSVHPALKERAQEQLAAAGSTLLDFCVTSVGDDLALVMTHRLGTDSPVVHELAWNTFVSCTEVARSLKLYGAGQDLLADAFSGNVRGMGPGVAEIEFEERPSEPIVVFLADKTEPGAFNLPVFRMFADPFNTIGLVIDPKMHAGFRFEVLDVREKARVLFDLPQEMYDLLVFIGAPSRFCIKTVYAKETGEAAAALSTQRLSLIAGRYVGKDDPVCIVRTQSGLPALGEVLEPFAHPHLVAGWMRGSHMGPLMPCGLDQATPTRFDGPPRVVALGFQVANGRLVGPQDLFADIAFDVARQKANEIADFMRRHGPFEPHRLHLEEMEYTTLPEVLKRLAGRFQPVD